MERHFEEELTLLKTRLLEMGGLAEDRLRMAVKALIDRNPAQLETVLVSDEAINALHMAHNALIERTPAQLESVLVSGEAIDAQQIEVDGRCVKLLALHHAVAVDLRAIVSAVKINTDLERVGDLAINIAEAGVRYLD